MSRTYFFIFALSFTLGILLRSFVNLEAGFLFFLAFLSCALLLAYFVYHARTVLFVSLFLVGIALGIFRFDVSEFQKHNPILENQIGKNVLIEGVIGSEPDERDDIAILVIKSESIYEDDAYIPIKLKIRFTTSRYPTWHYGDRVVIKGLLVHPEVFKNKDTGKFFDYPGYLAAQNIYYEIKQAKVSFAGGGEGNIILASLFELKGAFLESTGRIIREPEESLLGGLLVGAKQSLGKELLDDFRKVGIIHIVVLSGYNITIIGVFIEWLLSRLRKNMRLLLAAATMILFAIMVGASATVIRATVMALLVLLARGAGRVYDVTRALLLAGVIMLLHNPRILVFDTSFQLSFLATVGLIYVSPLIEPKTQWVSSRWHLRDIVVATIATQIFVLPFLLYKTGILSLVSLPVNLLILTAVPATMLFGFLAGLTGFLASALAAPFAFLSFALLA